MTRILLIECTQEVASFNPVPSSYQDFQIRFGEDILEFHHRRSTEGGGALDVFTADAEVEGIPTYSAKAITSGGTLERSSFERISRELLEAVAKAPPVDGVYFCLHGAMSAEGEVDPEGYFLEEVRRIVGENVPMVASFDLHGVLTPRMARNLTAWVSYHTYPHVDFFETGRRAARLLSRLVREPLRPVTAVVEIPALVRGDELKTETGVFGGWIRESIALEQSHGGLSAGFFIGNPFTDVPDLRSYCYVCTDGDEERARREAERLAAAFWAQRRHLQAELTPLGEAIELANTAGGTVIFMEPADATSSGASGDSNVIVRALLETGYRGRVLAPLVDPPAARRALEAGVGATVHTTVGGALDPRFEPLEVRATVRLLSDGHLLSESHNSPWYAGPTAVLEVENITLVVTSRPVSLYDRTLFLATGQNPERFDLVVVKSPHCQQRFFEVWAERLIIVDTPGATSADLKSLGHTVCRRPVFPLDADVSFEPKALIYRI